MRKQVQVDREVAIEDTMFQDNRVTAEKIRKTLLNIRADETIISFDNIRGTHEVWGGDERDEPAYHNYWAFTCRSWRPETDDEFFERQKRENNEKKIFDERERTQYLKLKAKFEPETGFTPSDSASSYQGSH